MIPSDKTFWIHAWIMSVDSLMSIEPVHTHCMHARIQNILSEGVVREDRNATKTGPSAKRHCQKWPTIECWLGSFVIFRGSGSIFLGNPIFLWFFRGGPDNLPPPSPPDPPIACIWKKVFVWNVPFIGHKVGLDYNSWHACLPLIRHVGRSKLFANFNSRS